MQRLISHKLRHFILIALFLFVLGALPSYAQKSPPQILVVGDSLIWGQGLREEDKTYSLVKKWFSQNMELDGPVAIKVKAHSGATLTLHEDEGSALKKLGLPETTAFHGEVSFGFPSTSTQLDMAAAEYASAGVSNGNVKLILISGCITDITVAEILKPTARDKDLPPLVERYCLNDMGRVLLKAVKLFPEAKIAVIGYFPMVSPQSSSARVFDGWLESRRTPRPLKPIANNPFTRILLGGIRKRAIERSRIWKIESDRQLRSAVDQLNSAAGSQPAVFVASPIDESTAAETPKTLLFKMGKGGRTEDPFYDFRMRECRGPYEMIAKSGLREPVRYCEVSGLGHPNPNGARAYANAIIEAIKAKFAR